MKKLLYFTLATFSIVFASCSMNKNNVNAGYLQSGKLFTSQQLTIQPTNEKIAPINIPVNKEIGQANSCEIQDNTVKFQKQGLKMGIKPLIGSNLVRKAGKSLTAIAQLPKAIAAVSQITKMPTHIASSKDLPFEGANYLVLWIVFLVAAALFFFLVNVVGEVTLLGVIFNILAILALLGFILFFIFWIAQLYKDKK